MNKLSSDKRPVLVPVKVPWQIDAAAPHLRLVANESAVNEPTHVTAYAKFLVPPGNEPLDNSGAATKIYPPKFNTVGHAIDNPSGAYRTIRCCFTRAVRSQMSPSYSDLQVVNTSVYDWDRIPRYSQTGDGIEISVRRFMEAWRASEFCPNPRMYEIDNSPWVRELGASASSFRHYLMLGHDAYVEVLAEDWDWTAL
jgi:hypothetical protein